jgi:hypothetical protein
MRLECWTDAKHEIIEVDPEDIKDVESDRLESVLMGYYEDWCKCNEGGGYRIVEEKR